MDFEFFVNVGKIVVIDLALAGDNALVIALAVRTLPKRQQLLGQQTIVQPNSRERAGHRDRGVRVNHSLNVWSPMVDWPWPCMTTYDVFTDRRYGRLRQPAGQLWTLIVIVGIDGAGKSMVLPKNPSPSTGAFARAATVSAQTNRIGETGV